MGGSNFDLLVQEVLKQQHAMEELEKENRELRRQLADLRTGRGIFIKIFGKSFTLGDEPTENAPAIATAAQVQPAASPADEAGSAEVEEPAPSERAPAAELAIAVEAEDPAEVVAIASGGQHAEVVAETPTAQTVEQEPEAVTTTPTAQVAEHEPEAVATAAPAAQAAGSATFLEEIMIDEFATASTKPMAVWNGPVNPPRKREDIDEEQKARLRRELTGSFLLE